MLVRFGETEMKIMGGEPTTHKSFFEAVEIIFKHFPTTNLFTNALNNQIQKFSPRENDTITYNFNFVSEKTNIEKFLLDKPGERHFEIQIASTTNCNIQIKKIMYLLQCFKNRPFGVNLTLNCQENIFLHKESIIEKWNIIADFLNSNGIEWGVDHIIPECFYRNTDMHLEGALGVCNAGCAGLINSNFEVLFCNQFPVKLYELTSFDIKKDTFYNLFANAFESKKLLCDQKCCDCLSYDITCNGGCFIHKSFVSTSV